MPRTASLGVVGLGRMGRLYAEIVSRSVEGARLVAVFSRTRSRCEEVARELGARCVSSAEEMMRDPEVEGVIVATPSYTHAEMIELAADYGKHVLVEKPIDVDIDRARRAVSRAERSGIKLLVGYMRRFHSSYRRAKELVDEGRIGIPYAYIGVSKDPEPPPPGWLRDPRLSGGLLLDLASHDFDLARWFLGREPIEVYARGGDFHGAGFGDADSAIATIAFEGGAFATVIASRRSPYGYDVRCEIHGTEGAVFVGSRHSYEVSIGGWGRVEYVGIEWFQKRFLEAYTEEVRHFARLVTGVEEKPLVSGRDALKALCVAAAARESMERGAAVRVAC